MSRAKGPPCIMCLKPVPVRQVTRCPWCRAVLCLDCVCPKWRAHERAWLGLPPATTQDKEGT